MLALVLPGVLARSPRPLQQHGVGHYRPKTSSKSRARQLFVPLETHFKALPNILIADFRSATMNSKLNIQSDECVTVAAVVQACRSPWNKAAWCAEPPYRRTGPGTGEASNFSACMFLIQLPPSFTRSWGAPGVRGRMWHVSQLLNIWRTTLLIQILHSYILFIRSAFAYLELK